MVFFYIFFYFYFSDNKLDSINGILDLVTAVPSTVDEKTFDGVPT